MQGWLVQKRGGGLGKFAGNGRSRIKIFWVKRVCGERGPLGVGKSPNRETGAVCSSRADVPA